MEELRKGILRLFTESEFREITVMDAVNSLGVKRRKVEKEIHEMYFEGIIEPAFKMSRTQVWYLPKSTRAQSPAPGLKTCEQVKDVMKLVIDLSQDPGFGLVLKDYQEVAMRYLWKGREGFSSRDVWEAVNREMEGERTISRASIINFLNSMVDEGFLGFMETTGKGGHRRIYHAAVNQEKFWKMIVATVKQKMTTGSGIHDLFG